MLFGIVQGGFDKSLREQAAKDLTALPFDGFAIGGVAIGEPKSEMMLAVDAVIPHLPEDKLRYVMGVGSPEDLLACVARGVDCFDSVYPTQNARHNTLFTWKGRLLLDKRKYATDFSPLDEQCDCPVCKKFTRAYMHHLMKIQEPHAKRLKSLHNAHFILTLMRKIREAIKRKQFDSFREQIERHYPSETSTTAP
jgi:queuine tRNA-ribosyltransferase